MTGQLTDILHRGHHSLVVENGTIRTFNQRGVTDLFHLLEKEPEFLCGASLADKVVGKGAAALMILGHVAQVHADIISESALELFRSSNVAVTYGEAVHHIINRKGDGICPVESLCRDCVTAEECLPLIRKFISSQTS